MPKWPRSSGPPRKVFGTCIVTPSDRGPPARTRAGRPRSLLKRAGGGEKGADLIEVLYSGATLDAGGDIDRDRTGNTDRLGQHLGGQAARQHPWAAPRPLRDQPPVESQTVAARQSIGPARRLRVEQQ